MSSWMRIGFDPNQMDPIVEAGGLSQAAPTAPGTVSSPNGSTKRGIAGALKRLITRRRTFDVPELKLR